MEFTRRRGMGEFKSLQETIPNIGLRSLILFSKIWQTFPFFPAQVPAVVGACTAVESACDAVIRTANTVDTDLQTVERLADRIVEMPSA